jgi:O-antigen ligase/tetratricopeptide (TPR) repeat protein
MSEVLRDPLPVAPGAELAGREPGPVTSLGIDLLLCVPALLVLARRSADSGYVLRGRWSVALWGAVALWAAASTLWASDRFAAAVGAAHLVGAAALLWAGAQLVRSWRRLRFLIAAAVGLLLVMSAAGLHHRLADHPDLQRRWFKTEREIALEDRGWKETDPAFVDYERRVLSGELGAEPRQRWNKSQRQMMLERAGWREDDFAFQQYQRKVTAGELMMFSHSPNTYAATLVMLLLLAVGAVAQRLADRDAPGWALGIVLMLIPAGAALAMTGSRAAMVVAALGALGLGAVAMLRKTLAARSRRTYVVGVAIVVLGAAAVVGHGLRHNSLPEKSLTFRWYYWTGAARMIAQHPLAGVGWDNFGRHYTSVRLPEAPEEVKDPHNFIVRALAELGIVGGLLVLAWLVRLWWDLTQKPLPPDAAPAAPPRRLAGALVAVAVAAVGLNSVLGLDLGLIGSGGAGADSPMTSGTALVLVELYKRAVMLILLVVGMALVAARSARHETLDERPARWLLYALLLALGAFLVQNLIEFALFEPGPMTVFALLAGAALGLRQDDPSPASPARVGPAMVLTAASLAWLVAGGALWLPTLSAEGLAHEGDLAMSQAGDPPDRAMLMQAGRLYDQAAKAQPLNADYVHRSAIALWSAGANPAMTRQMLRAAIEADPRCGRYWYALARFELAQKPPDGGAVRAAFEACLGLNHADVPTRVEYADSLTDVLGDRGRAVEQYRRALEYDAKLPADEPKRLKAAQRARVESRIVDNLRPATDRP